MAAQATLLLVLYALPAINGIRIAAVADPDVWWHLRTGQWILQHSAVPRTDPFSSFAAGKPWAAYSWLFELLVQELFAHLGLVGIVAYTSLMLLAITVALYRLARRRQTSFSAAILLVYLACFSMSHLYTPRPWLFSILFFILELDILMRVRGSGRTRQLAWLPLLFLLWANLHIQFVDGLIVLGLACLQSFLPKQYRLFPEGVSRTKLFAALLGAVLGTLGNPYGWHIYGIAHELASQTGVLNKLQELQAVPFRDPVDWSFLVLALITGTVMAWQRCRQPFEWMLFLFALVVGFRSQRDVWVLAAVATAILPPTLQLATRRRRLSLDAYSSLWPAAGAFLVVLFSLWSLARHPHRLETTLAAALPVHALDFVASQHLGGPVFNDYTWGGYLIWRLGLPVGIDGRAALYGDTRIDHLDALWDGQPQWEQDPELGKAGMIIGPVRSPLSQLLRMDPRYQLTYEDHLAVVFLRRIPRPPTQP